MGTKYVVTQDGKVSIGGGTPDVSSALDIKFTDSGFLLPRLTTVQRDAIATPAEGLQVYNTTTQTIDYYDGTSWVVLDSANDSLQKSYDGGETITTLAGVPVEITAPSNTDSALTISVGKLGIVDGQVFIQNNGLSYPSAMPSGFVSDRTGDSIANLQIGDVRGAIPAPISAEVHTILDDTAFTVPAVDRIDFGVDLSTLTPFPVWVAGVTTNLVSLSGVVIKSSNGASSENTFYFIAGLDNGGATNSVAILTNAITGAPAVLTSTSGTAKIFNVSCANSPQVIGGGFGNINVSGTGMGDGSASLTGVLNDSGNWDSLHGLFNIGSLTVAVSRSINLAPGFAPGTADVPFQTYEAPAGAPDAPDVVFLSRTADPTTPGIFGPGGLWYNDTANRFKFYNGATTETIATLTDITTGTNFFDATVASSGADYTTVASAIAAGRRTIALIGGVTETVNMAWSGSSRVVYIRPGVIWTLGDINHTGSSPFTVIGPTTASGAAPTFSYALTLAGSPISTSSGSITFQNIIIDNNSTAANTPIVTSGVQQTYQNVRLELPNFSNTGIILTDTQSQIVNLIIIGTGTSCSGGLTITDGSAVNIKLSGTFDTAIATITIGSDAIVENVSCTVTSAARIDISGGNLRGLTTDGGSNPEIVVTGNGSIMSDLELSTGSIDVQSFTGIRITNCSSDGLIDLSDGSNAENFVLNCKFDTNSTWAGANNHISNCKFDGAITLSGSEYQINNTAIGGGFSINNNNNRISNCDFTNVSTVNVSGQDNAIANTRFMSGTDPSGVSNLYTGCLIQGVCVISGTYNQMSNCMISVNLALAISISASTNDATIVGCRVGGTAGGGVGTINIVAGANRTIVSATRTDDVIVDAGTNTTLGVNQVY